ncbi:hypothetical protein M193_gp032 [Halorubrum tailed phage 7]|uniref:hypothetical protein n=1 Tax=Halorubrum tailed phage 7 TaxID=2847108 RepID=UPI0003348B2E|nr:hypothetical protein M193_gp032 [Halorubrum tailed phage 7]AGM10904.1 hypothetical protein HRTV7_32 [Halorubrum tailed phage 7]
MTYTSNLTDWAAPSEDRVEQGNWFIKKDEPFVAEYLNHVFYELITESQWAIDRLNAIDPDEDGQVEDAFTLRGKTPDELGGFKYIQATTPSGASSGASWLKDTNGLIYVHRGGSFKPQPEIGYDETKTFGEGITDGYSIIHENVPRTEIRDNGSIYLIPELTVADFEDGRIKPNQLKWGWTIGSSYLSAQTGTVLSGTYSGEHQSVGERAVSHLTRDGEIIQDLEFTVQVGSDTANINDFVGIEVFTGGSSGDRLLRIQYDDGDGGIVLTHGDGAGGVTTTTLVANWNIGATRSYEIDWDFPNDQFDIYLDGSLEGTYNLEIPASSYNQLRIDNETSNSGNTRSVFIDNIYTGARENGEIVVVFPEPDERIVEWDVLQFTRTLAGESVVVDVEDTNGMTLISDISSDDDLSAAVSGSQNFQLRVKFSRDNNTNEPSFDTVYRRWTMRPGDTGMSKSEKSEIEQMQYIFYNK